MNVTCEGRSKWNFLRCIDYGTIFVPCFFATFYGKGKRMLSISCFVVFADSYGARQTLGVRKPQSCGLIWITSNIKSPQNPISRVNLILSIGIRSIGLFMRCSQGFVNDTAEQNLMGLIFVSRLEKKKPRKGGRTFHSV